jgi:3-oxoacyl-[acyl-carrier protein] reductase
MPTWVAGSLAGKTAVITGAAHGIGAATAALFLEAGANLVLCDREAIEPFAERAGQRVLIQTLDVRDQDAAAVFIRDAGAEFGTLDVLVNNAGGTFSSPLLEVSTKGEAALIAENFTQITHFIREVVPVMPESSSIVNVTSIEAHRAAPDFAIYSAMKAGVENLTKSLALELAPKGIRVNAMAPDVLFTGGEPAMREAPLYRASPAPPLGRTGIHEDGAAAIWFLASPMARFITGITLHVDGGNLAAGGWHRSH